MRPTVLIDTDGVKADFLRCALRVVKEVTGKAFTPEDFKTWDIFDTIGKEHEKACYAEFDKPGFCAGFQPYPGAIEGVKALQNIADVYAITSPMYSSPHWMWERSQWLFEHFGIRFKNIYQCAEKYRVHGDFLIDDKLDHIVQWTRYWAKHKLFVTGLLWDQPYNREVPEDSGPPTWGRVRNWQQVYEGIEATWARR